MTGSGIAVFWRVLGHHEHEIRGEINYSAVVGSSILRTAEMRLAGTPTFFAWFWIVASSGAKYTQ
jgi:hypothetical protein